MKNLMKSTIVLVLLVTSTISIASAGKPKTPAERADYWLKRMTQPLTLTTEQSTQIKDLIIKKETQRDADRLKFENDKEGAKRAAQIRQREFNANLKKVLSADQFEKLQTIRKQEREKRKAKQAAKNGGVAPKDAPSDGPIPLDDEQDNE